MDHKTLMKVARAIHLARIQECSFPNHDGYTGYSQTLMRQPWPEDRKEAEKLYHAGQPYMDIAIAQAKAAIKAFNED